jgi:hypothetical protein
VVDSEDLISLQKDQSDSNKTVVALRQKLDAAEKV